MIEDYLKHKAERQKNNLPPLSLDSKQTAELVELLKKDSIDNAKFLINLLTEHVPAGVDQAAFVKAAFLTDIAKNKTQSPHITEEKSIELLGTMLGGYNVQSLVSLLTTENAAKAVKVLSGITLIFDAFYDVQKLHENGNPYATSLLNAWANAEWFLSKDPIPSSIKAVVFRIDGETNTDDLSPAQEAWSRADIPLHAQSILQNKMPDAIKKINALKENKLPIAYVGDIVGTGSSRKSAINSLQWYIGKKIPFIPNKNSGGIVLGNKIAPIFFNTAEDSGALPIQCDVSKMKMGDVIEIDLVKNNIFQNDKLLTEFRITPITILDELRAGGRIPLIIGRELTEKARATLKLPKSEVFINVIPQDKSNHSGYTLAQKIVGKACGFEGIRPGTYCEPRITTVGSQDTTGAMTRDELKELACLGFSADLVMQSFCHTAAYPKPVDIELQHSLPDFINSRGGVALKAGDGVIHSWLNRMILPDTVGTGGDSHTRFPLGISFPAGSGLVAFSAALGVMPLDMPESVLVKFSGELQPGITLRDLVNAIPYYAIKDGELTVGKQGKKNIFSGRIMEIEGLPDLKVEQAFEFSDASAERSANGCTVKLNKGPVIEYLNSNIALMQNMVEAGYQDERSLKRRIESMKKWLDSQALLEADLDATYAYTLNINLNEITEPLIACPNDPDNIKTLSEISNDKIDEVFIGSCMTNIGHYRAAAKVLEGYGKIKTILWVAPPTRMDEKQLIEEGAYDTFKDAGARTEIPGCSLCMGNQARVNDKANVFSTSTRNFDNRMGNDAQVYLGSAELAAFCSLLGYIPTKKEYLSLMADKINPFSADIYRYLNFDQMQDYNSKKVIEINSIS